LALAVPLSRFTPRVGGGSAFFVRRQSDAVRILTRGKDPFEAVSRFESGAEAGQRYVPLWSRWRFRHYQREVERSPGTKARGSTGADILRRFASDLRAEFAFKFESRFDII